jgi:hypothetical protein
MAKAKKSTSTATAVGVGAAATAVIAAAGAYWFYGSKDAAKHRKTARSWMLKARAEVMEAVEATIEKAGEIDKTTYMNIVAGVMKRYEKAAGATAAEVAQMSRDMKEAWSQMQKARKNSAPKKAAKKPAAKKAAKKTAKKVAKKTHNNN